jgi:GDP-L-fucose synthase
MPEKSTPIFVAGHRGLVGSAIVRCLAKNGFENIICRSRSELDLTDQRAVAAFFAEQRPQYVFLAAAKVGGIHANNTYPAEFINQNLLIQCNIIHQSYLHGIKKLLFLGSSCIYPKLCPQPMKEEYLLTGPLEPTNSAYAVAKIAGIEMCWAYHRQYGCLFMPVMPTNLYGPNDNFDLENSHVLPALIRKFHLAKLALQGDIEGIRADEKRFGRIPDDIRSALGYREEALSRSSEPHVLLWGTGTARREFLHVDDMADACLHIIRRHEGVELINVGCGEDMTIREVAGLVRKTVGYSGRLSWDSSKPDGTPRKLLDITRLSNTGFKASIGLEEGIQSTYSWYQKELSTYYRHALSS